MDTSHGFVAVHAGAGTHSYANEPLYKAVCKSACQQAMSLLKSKKSAAEAAAAAVVALEDSECTNAGHGSNLTINGTVECDACMMDGASLLFGAVGALSGVKNPIVVAQRLAEEQKLGHLPYGRVRPSILVGHGAQDYCTACGIDVKSKMITKSTFKTYNRYKRKCQETKDSSPLAKKHKDSCVATDLNPAPLLGDGVQDTVGAVCVDHEGNVAAASSSGGIWLKHAGRLGPAAVYGAGCWAHNYTSRQEGSRGGVASVTSGCGEHIIQTLLAKTCSDVVRHNDDFSHSLSTTFDQDFLGSDFLKQTEAKYGGVLIVKTKDEDSCREVELAWIHSTPSMGLAYMNGTQKSPTVTMSRLNDGTTPGQCYTMGGHVSSWSL